MHNYPLTQRKTRRVRRKHDEESRSTPPASASSKIDHVMHLQRVVGNKATRQILQREGDGQADQFQALFRAGTRALDSGDYAGAVEQFEAALKLNSLTPLQKAKCYYNAGYAEYNAGNYYQAVEYFGKVMGLGVINAKYYQKTLELFQKSRQAMNTEYDPKAVFKDGIAELDAGKYQDAIETFSMLVNMFDNVPMLLKVKAMYNMGFCYSKQGKYQTALAKYQEILEAYGSQLPSDAISRIQRAIRQAKRRSGIKHVKKSNPKKPVIF